MSLHAINFINYFNITVGNAYLWCGIYDWMSSHYELKI